MFYKDSKHSNRVLGVATIGDGAYTSGTRKKKTKEYDAWYKMIHRCYDENDKRYKVYGGRGVTVCERWLNFQNFAPWFIENYKDGFKIDKDLTNIGAIEYSPENCAIVPVEINNLLMSNNARRGKWPIGVSLQNNKFRAECWNGQKEKIFLGYYKTPEEAFNVYREFKKNVIREVSEKHFKLGNISEIIYTNLLNWEIKPYYDRDFM